MPAPLKITLTPEEEKTLKELEGASNVPKRTRQRAMALRLNGKGWRVKEIADCLDWAESTVRQTIHRWIEKGIVGLWEAKGRGRKVTWTEQDYVALQGWLEEPRSYSARQLSEKLAKERQVYIGAEQVRRILKKNGVGKD